MSIHNVSPLFRCVDSNPVIVDPRLQTHEGEENHCWTTAIKIASAVVPAIAIIASFVYLGPIGGFIVTGVLITTAWAIQVQRRRDHNHPYRSGFFSSLFSNSYQMYNPSRVQGNVRYVPTPIPPSGPTGHVGVGQGHFVPLPNNPIQGNVRPVPASTPPSGPTGHVGVGQGHFVPLPNNPIQGNVRPVPASTPPSGPTGHVGVGQGHFVPLPNNPIQGNVRPVPTPIPPSGPTGHVIPGGGHFVPPNNPALGIVLPPPSGSEGHVQVGQGHRR